LLVSALLIKNSSALGSKFGEYVLATVTITTQTVTETGVVHVANQATAAPSSQNHSGHVAGAVIQAHPVAAGLVILAGGAIALVGAEVVATTGIKATVAVAKATANGTIWLASKSVQLVLAAKGRLFGADDAVDAVVNELANAVQIECQPNVVNDLPVQANIPANVIAGQQQISPQTMQYGGQQELFPVRQIEGRNYPGDGPEGLSRLPDVDFRKYNPAYNELDSQRADFVGEHKKNA